MLGALVEFLGHHPGMCAGLLGALGGAGRLREVLTANDAWIAGPLREVLIEGRATREFAVADAADAANAILGAMLLAVLGRSMTGADTTDAAFRRRVTEQLVRGVLA
ncbi:hypothetical protein GCM10009682_00350 [Luedemannella flava]|uniref:Tetracyclin repressor-like C-terminal domain-containing protein n=1 Tax=Luedemannella flava TaxID=349316 RepID=A0ABP4XJX5_9ACTN